MIRMLARRTASFCRRSFLLTHPEQRHRQHNPWNCSQRSWISSKLSEQITPELKERLAGKITSRKFKMASISQEVQLLEEAEFPVPKTLTDDQWNQLLRFENAEVRARYLDALWQGKGSDELVIKELEERDKVLYGPLQLDDQVVDELVGDDEFKRQRVEDLKVIHEAMLMEGKRVLPHVDRATLFGVLETQSRSRIVSALDYISSKADLRFAAHVKKRARQATFVEVTEKKREAIEATPHIVYGLGYNTIFLRYGDRKLQRSFDWNAIREFYPWGQPLVIDMSFVKTLTMHMAKSLIFRELAFSLKANREAREPFAIYITSFDPNCEKCNLMTKAMPRCMDADYPAIITEKSYMELFPEKSLVYMSPDSKTDLRQHDPNDVYIIGAIVDVETRSPMSLMRAKKQGIRHARLPTKKVLGMHVELNVDHAVAVLADFKNTGDWFYSFRWVPPRYFKNRLKCNSYTSDLEAIYHAQHSLSPTSEHEQGPLSRISPAKYRRRYKELVEKFYIENNTKPGEVKTDNKYNAWRKDQYVQRKYGFLDRM